MWIKINPKAGVAGKRIITIGCARSTAMRRLIAATPATHLIDLTSGARRHTVLVLDSGHVVLTSLTTTELFDYLETVH